MADIVVSGLNPRKTFDDDHIKELAQSIKENGLIQAIVVRKVGKKPDVKYEIVCGECRYRASQLIGAETIKAEVSEMEDKKAFEFMILENLQRRDIKPLEEAAAINRLYTEGGYKIKEISKMLGKSDSFVISRIQLTNIIPQFAELMDKGTLFLIHLQEICKLKPEAQQVLFDTCFTPECVSQWDFKVLSMDKLADWINEHVLCSLSKARFSLSDTTYSMCGTCEGCPFNTASNSNNFKDVNNPRCMKRENFVSKNREALLREAKSSGLPVILSGTTDKELLKAIKDFGLKAEQLGRREYVIEPLAPSEDVFKDKESFHNRMQNFRKVKAVFDSNLADGSVVKVYELANGNKMTGEEKFLYNIPVEEHNSACGNTQSILNDITRLKESLEDYKAKRVSDEIEEQRKFMNGSEYSALNTDLSKNETNVFLALLLMRFGYDFKKNLGIDLSADASIKKAFPIISKNLPSIVREFIRMSLSEQSVNFSKDLSYLLGSVMKERFEHEAESISKKLDEQYAKNMESVQKVIDEKKAKISGKEEEPQQPTSETSEDVKADVPEQQEEETSKVVVEMTIPAERMVPALVEA